MPALCIPRRKSILIETIHHSQEPTDELLFLHGRGEERSLAVLCPRRRRLAEEHRSRARPPLLCRSGLPRDSILPAFAEFRLRTVGFGLSPRPPAVFASFFRRPVELCAAGFASFRGIPSTQRGHLGPRRYNFSLGFTEFMESRKFRLV